MVQKTANLSVKYGKKEKETDEGAKVRRESVTFKPRKNNVLVDVLEIKQRGTIIMPDSIKSDSISLENYDEHPFQGIVVALGPDCGKMPLGNTAETSADDLRKGQRIAFRTYSVMPVVDRGHVYSLLADHDVIGIIG